MNTLDDTTPATLPSLDVTKHGGRSVLVRAAFGAFEVTSVTMTGSSHTSNEDAVALNIDKLLFCVADGISGAAHGSAASAAASHYFVNHHAPLNGVTALPRFLEAHEKVRDATEGNGGASAVVMRLGFASAAIYHVGDCRAYRVLREDGTKERGILEKITSDHLLPTPVDVSKTEPDGKLAQALGYWIFEIGRHSVPLKYGELLILCSDGVYKTEGNDAFMRSLLHIGSQKQLLQSVAGRLSSCALEGDDASILVVRYMGLFGVRPLFWMAIAASVFVAFGTLLLGGMRP